MNFEKIFRSSFNKALKRYNKKKIIDLKNELGEEYIDILKRLDIIVKSDKYTGHEFEGLMVEIGSYYKDEEMTEEELEEYKPLEQTDVSQNEYNKLNIKIDNIMDKYKSVFILR